MRSGGAPALVVSPQYRLPSAAGQMASRMGALMFGTSPEPGVSGLGLTLRGIVIYCGLLPTCGLSAGDGLAAGEAVLAESSDFLYLGSLT